MCNLLWTPHSNLEKDNSLNHSCVSPKMGCLEYTNFELRTTWRLNESPLKNTESNVTTNLTNLLFKIYYLTMVSCTDVSSQQVMGHFHKKGQITVKTWRSIFNPVVTRYLCISIDICIPCDTYVL